MRVICAITKSLLLKVAFRFKLTYTISDSDSKETVQFQYQSKSTYLGHGKNLPHNDM